MIHPSVFCHARPKISVLLFLFFLPALLSHSSAASSPSRPAGSGFFRLKHKFSSPTPSDVGDFNSSHRSRLGHLLRLLSHDRLRHRRFLLSAQAYPLTGDLLKTGLYFTEIQVGTPPSTYSVQVDTGSDMMWLNCASCTTCPTTSDLGVALTLYNPQLSSTSATVNCGDSFCSTVQCSSGPCGYELQYGDGSTSQGYYVQDSFKLDVVNQSAKATYATVTFGCGTSQGGDLQTQTQALDGIMGFGQSSISIISQLVAQKQAPGIFAHCLDGEGRDDSGILVIGQVQASGLVYTPIVSNQSHYNVNLKSMTVNSVSIPLDTASSSSTIVDSGTTLAYFVDDTYQMLLTNILAGLPQGTEGFIWEGMTCILHTGSVDDWFPSVTLTFAGTGAIMVVEPHDYLIQVQDGQVNGWCIGFQNLSQDSPYFSILGDLVLQDKLVVYDLDQQRIGWVDYNCSSNVTVTTSTGEVEHVASPPVPSTSHANDVKLLKSKLWQTILWSFILLCVNYL